MHDLLLTVLTLHEGFLYACSDSGLLNMMSNDSVPAVTGLNILHFNYKRHQEVKYFLGA